MANPEENTMTDIEALDIPVQEVDRGLKFLNLPNKEELDRALVSMDNAIEFVEKVQGAVLKRSRPGDWVFRDGKPYFTEAGCNRFRAPFGIYDKEVKSWTIDADGNRREINDRNVFEGDIRFIFVAGIIGSKLLGVEAYFEGGAKLNDGFKEKDDVLFYAKKARANWYGTGIRKLTGMENFTIADLKAAGIDTDKVQAITSVTTAKADTGEAQELHDMILDLNDGDIKKAEDYLFKLTDNQAKGYKGKKRASQLSAGQMKWIMPKVHSEWKVRFPEKAATPEAKAEASAEPSSGFLKSVEALKSKVKDEEFGKLLAKYSVSDPYEVSAENQNKFLLELKKLAEGGK